MRERFRVDKFVDPSVLVAVRGSAIMADTSMSTVIPGARIDLQCASFPKLLNNVCSVIWLALQTSNEASCFKGKAAQVSLITLSQISGVTAEDNWKCKATKGGGSGSPDNV